MQKNSTSGMTLVEVLVAMAIVFIIFLGMSSGGIVVLNENIKNDMRDEAVSIAEMEMQQVRSIRFAVIDNASRIESRQIRGLKMDYYVNRTVLPFVTHKQVTANVSWTRWENNAHKSYSHQVMTIVRPN